MSKKVGRNDSCPCGSGKKYKKCHISSGFPLIERVPQGDAVVREMVSKWQQRNRRLGFVREAIATDFKGHKIVAVGNRLHIGKDWKTFPDFLMSYMPSLLSGDWGNGEIKKDFSERHPIMQWYDGLCRWQQKNIKVPGEPQYSVLNGVAAAYYLLAYDLYTIEHNARLKNEVIRRLKIKDLFQGARYELTVAATMVRAGFSVDFEDEKDGSGKHPEFLALHRETGIKFAVEAKSRHRSGILGMQGEVQEVLKADIGHLLTQAVLKEPQYPYIIFVDLNVPPLSRQWESNFAATPFGKELMRAVERAGGHFKDGKDHFNAVFFTNHPHHYGDEAQENPPRHYLASISSKPTYPVANEGSFFSISDALNKYGNVPKDFSDA